METQSENPLEDLEMVEELCAALSGNAKALVHRFKYVVERHAVTVHQLEDQRRVAKAELEAAERNFLVEKEALLSESKAARQRWVEEQTQLLEEKERLQRLLAEVGLKREDDRHNHAEKLLSLQRKHQEERQRLTAAWEAEKTANAALTKKLTKYTKENSYLRIERKKYLEGGVRASMLGSAENGLRGSKGGSHSLKERLTSLEKERGKAESHSTPSESSGQVHGITSPLPLSDGGNYSLENQGALALDPTQSRTPPEQGVSGRSPPSHMLPEPQPAPGEKRAGGWQSNMTAESLQAAVMLAGGADPVRSGSNQRKRSVNKSKAGNDLDVGLVREVGPATRVGDSDRALRPVTSVGGVEREIGPTTRVGNSERGVGPTTRVGDLSCGVGLATRLRDLERGLGPATRVGNSERGVGPATRMEGLEGGLGPATRDGEQPCREKRSLGGAAGDLSEKERVSGRKAGEVSVSSRKRRKHTLVGVADGASRAAHPFPAEPEPIGSVSSMETLLLTRRSQEALELEEREAAGDVERPPTGGVDAQNGRDVFPATAAMDKGLLSTSTRLEDVRIQPVEARLKQSQSGGVPKPEASTAEGWGGAKRDRSQLVSTLNRQRRAVSAGNSGLGLEDAGLELTSSVSAVSGAQDQNEVSGSRGTVSSPRAGSEGLRTGYEWQLGEGHAVSDGAARETASDSDEEVCSPKRRRRARSAGVVRSSGLGAPLGKKARNLAESFGGVGEARKAPPSEEEGFELGGRSTGRAIEAEGVTGRTDALPRGEKGRWTSVREGKIDPRGKKDNSQRLVQTRLSQPTRRDGPVFKPPTNVVREAGGRKWREASRAMEDDFLSTPMEKALAGRGVHTDERLSGGKRGQTGAPTGRNSMARDLGTGAGDQRCEAKLRREVRLAEDSDRVSDSEKENSQPDDGLETPDAASQVCLDGAGSVGAAGREVPGQGDGQGLTGQRNRGIQVIKPGTYALTAAERGKQLASGDVPAHRYNAVIRKKEEREGLHAMDCANCRKFYDAVVALDGEAMERNVNNACSHQHQLDVAGRHRYQYAPPATPSGFWNIGFDTETQAAS